MLDNDARISGTEQTHLAELVITHTPLINSSSAHATMRLHPGLAILFQVKPHFFITKAGRSPALPLVSICGPHLAKRLL